MKTFNHLRYTIIILLSVIMLSCKSGDTNENTVLNLKTHVLSNGLKIHLIPRSDVPRISTGILIKSGSTDDPDDATGLAHYLEHLVFKGTDKLGALNFEKEQPLLEEIENLYEMYRNTKDENRRKNIYKKIDSLSLEASQYSLSREYWDIMNKIGAWGINAFTNFDRTGYVSEIPSNQLERWLKLEAERFRNPQFRTFHTELEVVYEESNSIVDDGARFTLFEVLKNIFKKHPYGYKTTIGKIEHLKNPSIKLIRDYYNTYYVPNNMAIVLVGDFDPEKTIKLIDENFGSMKYKELPEKKEIIEDRINQAVVKEVVAPGNELLRFGYRYAGQGTKEAMMFKLIDMMLMNGRSGIFDININSAQRATRVSTYIESYKDYSVHFTLGIPKENQTLEELKKLILDEIDNLKRGDFPDWLQDASINDLKQRQMRSLETNSGIRSKLFTAESYNISIEDLLNEEKEMKKVTKEEIMEFAKTHFNDNYVVIYKREGVNEKAKKIKKPIITPIQSVQGKKSNFAKALENKVVNPIASKFLKYKEDFQTFKLNNGLPIHRLENKINDLFTLEFVIDKGQNADKFLKFATDYIPYLSSDNLSNKQIKEEFYKIGCAYSIRTTKMKTSIVLSGLNENLSKAIDLLKTILSNPKIDNQSFDLYKQTIIKQRENLKKSKFQKRIWSNNYFLYGSKSPNKNIVSAEEMQSLKPNDLEEKIKSLLNYEQKIYYYGPSKQANIKEILATLYKNSKELIPTPHKLRFPRKEIESNQIYIADFKSKQIDLVLWMDLSIFNTDDLAMIYIMNEYFRGFVQRELRERKSLAYSSNGYLDVPINKDKPFNLYTWASVQDDKYIEATETIINLIRNMEMNEESFNNAKKSNLEKMKSERITGYRILSSYQTAQTRGIEKEIREYAFNNIPKITFEEFKAFYKSTIKNNYFSFLLLGNTDIIDEKILEKYGEIHFLENKDIFGF